MALLADNLVESSDLLAWFDTVYTANQSKIDFCCNASSQAIEKYCSRKFFTATYNDKIISQGTDQLFLSHYPIKSITSFFINDSTITSDLYLFDSSLFNSGIIQMLLTSVENQRINITYSAGYNRNELPYDLKLACLLQTTYYFNLYGSNNSMLGYSEISKMGETIKKDTSLTTGGLLGEVIGIIEKYKRNEVGTLTSHRYAL